MKKGEKRKPHSARVLPQAFLGQMGQSAPEPRPGSRTPVSHRAFSRQSFTPRLCFISVYFVHLLCVLESQKDLRACQGANA